MVDVGVDDGSVLSWYPATQLRSDGSWSYRWTLPSASSCGTITVSATAPCVADDETLCLNAARFAVAVDWQSQDGRSGAGQAVPMTADTGLFWFFRSGNLELMVKVLDGRGLNGYYWVFYGALSDVDYTITVTDTATGSVRTYHNPQGQMASTADTQAFAGR